MITVNETQLNAINNESPIHAVMILADIVEDNCSLLCLHSFHVRTLDSEITEEQYWELDLYAQQVFSLAEVRLSNASEALARFTDETRYFI